MRGQAARAHWPTASAAEGFSCRPVEDQDTLPDQSVIRWSAQLRPGVMAIDLLRLQPFLDATG